MSQRFETLEAYLAWLERRAQLGGAWYKEIRPGVYALQAGNLRRADGEAEPRLFTREELAAKFGFSR